MESRHSSVKELFSPGREAASVIGPAILYFIVYIMVLGKWQMCSRSGEGAEKAAVLLDFVQITSNKIIFKKNSVL